MISELLLINIIITSTKLTVYLLGDMNLDRVLSESSTCICHSEFHQMTVW